MAKLNGWRNISMIWLVECGKIIVLHVRHANYQICLTYLTNDDETYLAIIEWRWAGYKEFYRSRRVLSTDNLQRAALLTSFWRHRFNNLQQAALLTSLIQYDRAGFQIWWTAAGYGESCLWFQPIRKGEIFWMNYKIISHTPTSIHVCTWIFVMYMQLF